jgi:hypothetical protein
MSEDALAALVVGYMAGCLITLLSMDMPRHETYLFRRIAVWPLYWAYLLVKMGFMLAHEVRR